MYTRIPHFSRIDFLSATAAAFFTLMTSPNASAATWTQAGITITRVDSGTDGNLIVGDQSFTESCGYASIGRIDPNSPDLNRIMSLAMMALSTGMKVQFFVNGCIGSGGSTAGKITDIRLSK